MKHKPYSVEKIVATAKQHKLGTSVADIIRKLQITESGVASSGLKHRFNIVLDPLIAQESHIVMKAVPQTAYPGCCD